MPDPRLAHHVQGDLKKQFYKAYGRDEDGICAIERYIPNERYTHIFKSHFFLTPATL